MYKKTIYVLLIAFLITHIAEGKKPKRSRRPNKNDEEDTTPQPNVVSYSTFGFNDVGPYDGFVPTSPDYANYLSKVNQESTTRLYAPAFPTALDPTGYNSNYPSSSLDGFTSSDDGGPQSSMIQYPQSSMNFYNTPTFDSSDIQNMNVASYEGPNTEEVNGPVYGSKINLNNKRIKNQFNNSEFNAYSSSSSGTLYNSNDMAPRFPLQENHAQNAQDGKITYGESVSNIQNLPPSYIQNFPSSEIENFVKPDATNVLKFPRVVDFTKIKQYYPTELDNKYQVSTYSSLINNNQNENTFTNNNESIEKDNRKPVPYPNKDYSPSYLNSLTTKSTLKGVNYNSDFKDNYKNKWASSNHSNDSKNWRSPMKGFEYSSKYSNTSVKFDYSPEKSPFNSNTDELVPAGTNNVESNNFNFPEPDFSNFKKIPEIKFSDDDYEMQNEEKFKSDEYLNQFKNLYTTTPVTTTQWGNLFKPSDYSNKHRVKRPQYDEGYSSDVVHIPRRPFNSFKHSFGQTVDNKPNDYSKHRPYKSNKYEKPNDWTKDAYKTRFKSEEDLLDLRNHDTSHPSYLPSHRPNINDLVDEVDYKKLVEKWRQSYLKSKYREAYRDYESYASEQKPLHVPIPKPYPIEVPHPVIVPVPQPYPVRVPVPKPVAVPVVKELIVPIEKPVPYPVVKKVPYPIEKPVPVHVEKEVQVPVIKPYPVHIPHVRPVFHHSRPPREDFESGVDAEEDDYLPRPESTKKIPPYRKKPRSTRNRPRRPTRMTYLNRNTSRRRWPNGYRSSDTSREHGNERERERESTRGRRPSTEYQSSYRHHDFDADRENDSDQGDYYYCKRTGRC